MGKLLDSLRKKHATTPPKANRHVLSFLAHKEDITVALHEGWSAKQIWEQMVEDDLTTMSYANLCRLVKKHIKPLMEAADGVSSSMNTSMSPGKTRINTSAKKSKRSAKELSEKERLDLLKEEAFLSVRSRKSTKSLIEKPKSREEENRELFGK